MFGQKRLELTVGGGIVAAVLAAAAGWVLFTAPAGTDGSDSAEPDPVAPPALAAPAETSAPAPTTTTTTTTTTATSTTTAVALANVFPVVPGLDAETAANLAALPHPGVTVLTEDTLSNELINQISRAVGAVEYDEDPTMIYAAFTKDGVTHTTVEYPSGVTALAVIEGDEVSRFRHDGKSWIEAYATRKQGVGVSFAYTQVSWIGVPDEATSARLTTVQRPEDIDDQRVIGNSVFFELRKPDWTQYATLELLDASGQVVASEEIRLHGEGCSSWFTGPISQGLPQTAVNDARVALATQAFACRYGKVAEQAVGDGPFFGVAQDELLEALREGDRRQGLMRSLMEALKEPPKEVVVDGRTMSVFEWTNPTLNNRIELGFSEDGVWQYGVLEDL